MSLIDEINELQKQVEQLRPLGQVQQASLRAYYKIGLTYSSNSLEGNSLTESETKVIIEDGLTIGGKSLREHYEAIGHAEAYEHLHQLVRESELEEGDILYLHRLFYQKMDADNAGTYRKEQVFLSGSQYPLPKPGEIPQLMKQFLSDTAQITAHPVEKAAIVHKGFVFIHPFIDGNGRIARLLMNLILMQAGYPITIIPPAWRAEYIAALEKAHTDDQPFIRLIAQCVKQSQTEYIQLLT